MKKEKSPNYEFGGPIGALMTMLSLPIVIVFLYINSNKNHCMEGADLTTLSVAFTDLSLSDLLTFDASVVVVGWFLFQVVLERTLPGKVVEGVVLPPGGDSKRLSYVMSGHLQFWVSLASVAAGEYFGVIDLTYIYDNYLQLGCAASLFSTVLSVYLYAVSFIGKKQLAHGGNTGNPIYDFFIGRELNPRIGSFDFKEFCELRPGLIGWTVINLSMMVKQYQLTGTVSYSMQMVNIFQGLYVWDALYQEQAILTTMDITSDGLGFMLTFGDLAWVPFTYSLQGRYLVDRDPSFDGPTAAVISFVCFTGYLIFRGANSEKDAFRRDPKHPSVAHLRTMDTNRPDRKLLVSGWWGLARKINYTGDWIMGLSWSLFTGFGTMITYFYPIYFAILLIHRAGRDNEMCAEKYGTVVWNKYKKQVPYLFIPKVI